MDLYSTHLEFLDKILSFIDKPEVAIEFGMGNYSTELLIKKTINLISIEMQSENWFNEMVLKFSSNKNWKPLYSFGPNNFLDIEYPNSINFSFIDGHGDSRPDCINFMMQKNCPIIVAHDTEESGYGWDRVLTNDYKKIDFKKFKNWSTLWTTNVNLYNFLKNE